VKRIHFEPEVPGQIRAIPRHIALTILEAIHLLLGVDKRREAWGEPWTSCRRYVQSTVGERKRVYEGESDVAIERAAGAYGLRLDVVPAFASVYPIL